MSAVVAASVIASNNAARAAGACREAVAHYPTNPTVDQMQFYAACVQRLYPAEFPVDIWVVKATVVFLLLCMVAGFVQPMIGRSMADRALSAFFYPIMGAAAILVCVLVILAVRFLFN